jgi:hypothetical protein
MKDWLGPYSWEFVTAQNAVLCNNKNAHHGPTSDGHDDARRLWSECHSEPMTLSAAVDLCRRSHQFAPFCFYNGNTFAAIMRDAVLALDLEPEAAYVVRSLVGHIVAGVASTEEEDALKEFSASLE